jgi:hypothetical protein
MVLLCRSKNKKNLNLQQSGNILAQTEDKLFHSWSDGPSIPLSYPGRYSGVLLLQTPLIQMLRSPPDDFSGEH